MQQQTKDTREKEKTKPEPVKKAVEHTKAPEPPKKEPAKKPVDTDSEYYDSESENENKETKPVQPQKV